MHKYATIATTVVGIFLAGQSHAADIGGTPAFTPTTDWTGVYLGVHGGFGAFGVDVDEADITGPGGPFTVIDRDTPDGLLGGVSAGYDYQSGSWVYGAEADFSWSSVEGFQTSDFFGPARTDVELEWLGTLRARLGYLASDNLLIYGTGGLAVGRVTEVADVGGVIFRNDNTHVGVAVGGGAEWMLADGISARAEALYVHLSEETYGTVLPADASGYGVIGRIGVGVRF